MSKKYDKYNQFIFVCKDKDCNKNGAKGVEKAFEKAVKKHGINKHTKIIECKCTGRCEQAPVAIVNNQWLGYVKPEEASDIVQQYMNE